MIGSLCRFAFNDDDSVRDGSFFRKGGVPHLFNRYGLKIHADAF
jgi:hypothetical protein